MADERERNPAIAEDTAANIGRSLGRLARRAHQAALDSQPDAERLARRAVWVARDAAGTARPEAERIAQQAIEASRPAAARAARYAREHEDEIRRAGGLAGEALAWRVLPRPLRPFLSGAVGGLFRRKPPEK